MSLKQCEAFGVELIGIPFVLGEELVEGTFALCRKNVCRDAVDGLVAVVVKRRIECYRNFYGKLVSSTSSSRSAST